MRKFAVSFVFVLALTLGVVDAAYAITNGQPDGNLHPYVGLADNGQYACSGTLLSPTVFLTAAHCFDPGDRVRITFDSNGFFARPRLSYFGTFYPDPQFCIGCEPGLVGFDTHDVAVVVLEGSGVPTSVASTYGQLPSPNLVDTLPMKTEVTIVGYGVQNFIRGGGPPRVGDIFTRFFAPSQLIQSNNSISGEFIKLTANPAKGKGGICFGDSGGPDLLGDTNTILAVNSFVSNSNCAGVTYSYRIDTPEALSFINQFFTPLL
jgi:hypothetical protein